MKSIYIYTILLAGLALVSAGVAFIYWPVALVVAGFGLIGIALTIDVDGTLPSEPKALVEDESEHQPVMARIRG